MLSRNPELEAAIVEEPTDWSRFAVYGDWLTRVGDPRGELMVAGAELSELELAGRTGSRAMVLRRAMDTLWREREEDIAGSLLGLEQHGLALTWRGGTIVRADLEVPPDDGGWATVAQLLAHPAGFALRGVGVSTASLGEHGFNYQPIVDLVSEEAPLTLRGLSLGDFEGWTEDETVVLGELRPLFARHQRLTALSLAGRASTVSAPWGLPMLRELTLRPVGLSRTWLRVLTAEVWPRLERLTFSYVSALDGDIGWLCASRIAQRFPKLTHLAVVGGGDATAVIDALGATGLSRQLVELDLSWGRFGEEAVTRLDEDREDFPKLRRLWLEREHRGFERLRAALPWISVQPAIVA